MPGVEHAGVAKRWMWTTPKRRKLGKASGMGVTGNGEVQGDVSSGWKSAAPRGAGAGER